MDTPLVVLMGITTFLLILALFIVIIGLPFWKKGWELTGKDDHANLLKPYDGIPKQGSVTETKEQKEVPKRPERHPLAVGSHELNQDDIVYIETQSGSTYAFQMKNSTLGLYHLRGTSASRGKYFDMTVVVDCDFVPGRTVMFWTVDRTWHAITTVVTRLLVDRATQSAANE